MIHKSYKFRLSPNKTQTRWLQQTAGNCRSIWNQMLERQITKYQAEKKFVFAFDMANQLPELKKTQTWLATSPHSALQQACIDQDKALKSVWKSGFGFPKFKSKHRSKDSFRIPQINGHIKFTDSHIKIPKIGWVKWVRDKRLMEGKFKSITISRDVNHWYVSVLTEHPDVCLISVVDPEKTIGIDLGVAHFATLSDGTKIESPGFLKRKLDYLKRVQRALAKKIKGSSNRRKACNRLAKIHRKIRHQRLTWLHQLSHSLVEKYQVICVEDLATKELLEKRQISRSIADQGWAMFVDRLAYKAKWRGKHLTKIDQYAPSTKACSCCGSIRKMTLADRVYICENPDCVDYLKTKDRDLNAATNIHFWGLAATPVSINRAVPARIHACGEPSSLGSLNQELFDVWTKRNIASRTQKS